MAAKGVRESFLFIRGCFSAVERRVFFYRVGGLREGGLGCHEEIYSLRGRRGHEG